MEFKVRGNVVLFDALEIKKASKLILGKEDKEYKYVVTHVGDVEGINIGDEIVLRSAGGIETTKIGDRIHFLTAPHNILAVVTGNDVETYSFEETFERNREVPNTTKPDLIIPHNQDIVMPNN